MLLSEMICSLITKGQSKHSVQYKYSTENFIVAGAHRDISKVSCAWARVRRWSSTDHLHLKCLPTKIVPCDRMDIEAIIP